MKHIFPFSEIKKGEKVVLYGASERGYDFYRQLVSTGYDDIVLWVDRQYEWYRYMNLPVDAPEKIKGAEFDRIIITAEEEHVYESMMCDLAKLGVDAGKIFWKKDCLITGNIAYGYDNERIEKEAHSAYEMNPIQLLSAERLDVIVRILYAKDVISESTNKYHMQLYRKMMTAQNNCTEPTDNMISSFFSEYSIKRGWKAFDESFKGLINSIRTGGFCRWYFVPLDRSKNMINGAHRVAAAIALDTTIWAYEYPVDIKPLIFNEKWFLDNGFTRSETEYIAEKYRKLVL